MCVFLYNPELVYERRTVYHCSALVTFSATQLEIQQLGGNMTLRQQQALRSKRIDGLHNQRNANLRQVYLFL